MLVTSFNAPCVSHFHENVRKKKILAQYPANLLNVQLNELPWKKKYKKAKLT